MSPIAESAGSVRGRRAFVAGIVFLFVFGAAHGLAVYSSNFKQPATEDARQVQGILKETVVQKSPFQATTWGAVQILSCSYSALLFYVAMLNALAFKPMIAAGRLRALTITNIVFAAVLLLVTVIFRVLPPMLFSVLVLLCFFVSFTQQGIHGRRALDAPQ